MNCIKNSSKLKGTTKALIKCYLTQWINSILTLDQCYDIEQSYVLHVCIFMVL